MGAITLPKCPEQHCGFCSPKTRVWGLALSSECGGRLAKRPPRTAPTLVHVGCLCSPCILAGAWIAALVLHKTCLNFEALESVETQFIALNGKWWSYCLSATFLSPTKHVSDYIMMLNLACLLWMVPSEIVEPRNLAFIPPTLHARSPDEHQHNLRRIEV